jgi:phospholipid/cholesterol/gamma-HCH transport system permease protein
MATWVVLVGCYYGYTVKGGPAEVGRATAKAMIVNLVGVHFIGIIGSQVFWGGSPRLPIGG